MKFVTYFALIGAASALRLHDAPKAAPVPVPLSEAKPNAALGAVDNTKAGVAQHEQAKVDQHVTGFMIGDSDAVWKAAEASKNKPIATTPIATPPGPSLPLHNPGKAGNGDTVTSSLVQGAPVGPDGLAWHCKCMGTTCWDHEGATCHQNQIAAHDGQKLDPQQVPQLNNQKVDYIHK